MVKSKFGIVHIREAQFYFYAIRSVGMIDKSSKRGSEYGSSKSHVSQPKICSLSNVFLGKES